MMDKDTKKFLRAAVISLIAIALLVLWAVTANAWTTHEFRVGYSTVYSIDDDGNPTSYKKWNVTSHPEYMGSSDVYRMLYSYNKILQVMLIRRVGKEDRLLISHRLPETDARVQAGLVICRRAMELLGPLVGKTGEIIISYHVDLQQINLFLLNDNVRVRDRKLHEKMARVLNEARSKLIKAGDFTISKRLVEFYERYKPITGE